MMRQTKRLLLGVAMTVLLLLAACGKPSGESDKSSAQKPGQEPPAAAIQFPYELADGKLTANSLFPSSIDNPDFNGEYGDDIATLEIVNTSDEFLQEAAITVQLADGTTIPFAITNLPAGSTVWAFAANNASIQIDPACTDVACTAGFTAGMPVLADQVSFEVHETEVTLHNLTSTPLTNLSVGCHCLFDGVYFGGVTYHYSVNTLPANASSTFSADDCYLDGAEVVSITNK